MVDTKDRSLVASIAFAEILDYAKKPVVEQIKLTDRFNALLVEALSGVAASDRIILDTSNGAAITFLGKTEDALLLAVSLRDRIAAEATVEPVLSIRVGINIGPVKLVKEPDGDPSIVGDGITVAHSVMDFAKPGQILVSHAYCEAVTRVSRDYEKLFEADGARTDKYLREHQVYAIGKTPANLRPREPASAALDADARNRKIRIGVLAAVAAILVLAIGVRSFRGKPEPPPAPPAPVAEQAPAPPPAVSPPVVVPETPPAPPPETKPVPKKKVAKKVEAPVVAPAPPPVVAAPAPLPPGSLHFTVTPWGEIFIDGTKRGVSPPLIEVQIAAGKHNIEIHNTSFPAYTTTVEVTSGAQSKIKYKFN